MTDTREVKGRFLDSAGLPEAGITVTAVPQLGASDLGRTTSATVIPTEVTTTADTDGIATFALWPYRSWRPAGVVYEIRWDQTIRSGAVTVGTRRRSQLVGVLDQTATQWLHDPRLQVAAGEPFDTDPPTYDTEVRPSSLAGVPTVDIADRGAFVTIDPGDETRFRLDRVPRLRATRIGDRYTTASLPRVWSDTGIAVPDGLEPTEVVLVNTTASAFERHTFLLGAEIAGMPTNTAGDAAGPETGVQSVTIGVSTLLLCRDAAGDILAAAATSNLTTFTLELFRTEIS